MTSPMDGEKEELDRLVREDMDLGRRIAPHEKVRDACLRACAHRVKEAEATFERDAGEILRNRAAGRARILAIWKERHDAQTTLDLPCALVSRRNYTALKVRDPNALLRALDRADRLDLVGQTFDEKDVIELLKQGKLADLPTGAVKVLDSFNLQVRPRKSGREKEG